ncbi:hypothetical protein C8E01_10160 [Pontibacter virosus]|uniref:Uncharacterized protein n=1 Tax=Pontibacter virosus TaxID=1765052 RepID=A0A2U1B4U0_9BACT|nr:hypothetical protein C8E01_10160 [Pontibacter virosus]
MLKQYVQQIVTSTLHKAGLHTVYPSILER